MICDVFFMPKYTKRRGLQKTSEVFKTSEVYKYILYFAFNQCFMRQEQKKCILFFVFNKYCRIFALEKFAQVAELVDALVSNTIPALGTKSLDKYLSRLFFARFL